MVRELHDLSAQLVPQFPVGAEWYAPELVREPIEVICHNDLAPWNVVSLLLGFDDPDDPPRRLRLLADAYGLAEPADLLDTVLARQQAGLEGIRRRAEAGERPTATCGRKSGTSGRRRCGGYR